MTTTSTPTPQEIREAVQAHGSMRAAARELGKAESTLRGILKREPVPAVTYAVQDEAHRFPEGQDPHVFPGLLVHPEDVARDDVEAAKAHTFDLVPKGRTLPKGKPTPKARQRVQFPARQREPEDLAGGNPVAVAYAAFRERERPFRRAFGNRAAIRAAGTAAIAERERDLQAILQARSVYGASTVGEIAQRTGLRQRRVLSIALGYGLGAAVSR